MNRTRRLVFILSLLAFATAVLADPFAEVSLPGSEPRAALRYRPAAGPAEPMLLQVLRGDDSDHDPPVTPDVVFPLSVEVSQVLDDGGFVLVLSLGAPRFGVGISGAEAARWAGLGDTRLIRVLAERGLAREAKELRAGNGEAERTPEEAALLDLLGALPPPVPEEEIGRGGIWFSGRRAQDGEAEGPPPSQWMLRSEPGENRRWVERLSPARATVQIDPARPFPSRVKAVLEVPGRSDGGTVEPLPQRYQVLIGPPAPQAGNGMTSQGVAPRGGAAGAPANARGYAGRYLERWTEDVAKEDWSNWYRIEVRPDGTPLVGNCDIAREVSDVRWEDGDLAFTVRADSEVRYRLKLDGNGSLIGSAAATGAPIPVWWRRVEDPPPAAAPMTPADAAKYAGRYVEFWAEGEETDVTYHDEYEVAVSESGAPVVTTADEKQTIAGARWADGGLVVTIRTTFDVVYRLERGEDGDLRGTATTPEKVVPIRWARAGAGDDGPGGAAPPPDATALAGNYVEFWAEGQETDVAYHDEYRISVSETGALVVTPVDEEETIAGVRWAGGVLSITVRTNFDVVYRLKLSEDGDLRGTATTPEKVVPIRWARADAALEGDPPPPDAAAYAGDYVEFWAEGQETDVTYHDEYEIVVSAGGVPIVRAGDQTETVAGARWGDGGIVVTLRTSFDVVYRLKRSEDGDLRGTATTPKKTVTIRWGRVPRK